MNLTTFCIVTAAQHPSYGELIDLLEQAEQESRDFARTLCDKVHQMYPDLTINRPARFYDTVKRIAAPTRASLKGPSKLQGSPLLSYRKRQWIPKNHNPPGITIPVQNAQKQLRLYYCHYIRTLPVITLQSAGSAF